MNLENCLEMSISTRRDEDEQSIQITVPYIIQQHLDNDQIVVVLKRAIGE
jgi:hypothetical protein